MKSTHMLLILLGAALLNAGCLDVADHRAELDSQVGHARAGGAEVDVDDGLARVSTFEPGELGLWAQAPDLKLRLQTADQATGDQARTWSLRVQNAMPGAVLTVTGPQDAAVSVEQRATERATERATVKYWQLELAADTEYHLRIAPPDADRVEPWHFAVFADVQERIDDVGDIYRRMRGDDRLRFCLISGDLTEMGTVEQLQTFRDKLVDQLDIPCFATLGNHELGTDEELFREYFGRGNFSFAFKGTRFTLIDSASATLSPMVYDWLGDWLVRGEDQAHVFLMHIPPVDPVGTRNGSFASHAEANKLLKMLADHDVDLTIYGHVHSYYAFSNAGIPAYITGGGGAIPERFDGIGRHFVKIRALPESQDFEAAIERVD